MSRWIFLRGLSRESRHWGEFPEVFGQAIPEAEVLTLDLPGNGQLHGMDSPADVVSMAEYCRAELIRRGLPPPYHLLAMSLGAMVAVVWADRHPEEIAGSVLINTSLRPCSPFYRRLRPVNYPALLCLLLGGSPRQWEETILRLTSRLIAAPGAVVDRWMTYRQDSPVSHRNALRQLLAAARYRAPAGRPMTPTLLLTSAQDALVDTRCSQALAARWQAAIAVHPEAGHDIPLDDGRWVARTVADWLRGGAR